jgi:glycosyltransferase involved in cell wall biosynthesis
MKVSHVVDSISRDAGGVFFSVNSLARALSDSGVLISVHGLRDGKSEIDRASWAGLDLSVHETMGPRRIGYSPGLTRALPAGEQDLLHVHGVWQAQSYSVHHWHRRTGKPYLITPHGMLDPWALAQSRWKKGLASRLFERSHLRDAACLHALCRSELDSIRAYGLTNPVCLIPNGVDLPEDRESVVPVNEEWVTGHGNERKKILLFLGRLHPKKGLINALKAWKEVTGHRSRVMSEGEWQFVIAGWDQGGHLEELKQLCSELGLSYADGPPPTAHRLPPGANGSPPAVLFTGPVFGEAKDSLLRSADAFILPSFSEGLPMAVLEAWAYGLPVLMTDHCNLPEGFTSGAALRIGTDTPEIAAGMHWLAALPEPERIRMGQAGRALVEDRFTWPKVAAQMKGVYAWMLGEGERPGEVIGS